MGRIVVESLQPKLERYLDLLSFRQRLVASNIANADTPGYHTRDIDFQFEFMSLAEGAAPRPIDPHLIEPEGLTGKNDGNNVNIDREARLLSENAMRFQFASQLLKGRMQEMKSAIQGGR